MLVMTLLMLSYPATGAPVDEFFQSYALVALGAFGVLVVLWALHD